MAPRRKFVSRPDSVIVAHRTYHIHWLEQDQWIAEGIDDGLRGWTEHASGRILIRLSFEDARSADDMLREIVLHEILHACTSVSMVWNSWGPLDNEKCQEFATIEELIIGAMSPVLLRVLLDNPNVLAYLLDDQEHE